MVLVAVLDWFSRNVLAWQLSNPLDSFFCLAALQQALQYRTQDLIDRRFYRKKYDAEKVLAAFSTTLREEVDLDRLTNAILAVVEETMKPEHVSLWLREVDVQPRKRQSESNSSQISS